MHVSAFSALVEVSALMRGFYLFILLTIFTFTFNTYVHFIDEISVLLLEYGFEVLHSPLVLSKGGSLEAFSTFWSL